MITIEVKKLGRHLPAGIRRPYRMSADRFRRWRGKRILYCFGDSHIHMYRHTILQGHLKNTIIRSTCARGATAYGIANPHSRSKALSIFQQRLRSVSSRDDLLFMLGEVDCGSLIWYRSAESGQPAEALVEESLDHYQAFLSSVIGLGFDKLIVSTIPLPTIFDNPPIGETDRVRHEVPASLAQRTELTLRYNARLREYCQQTGLRLLDFEAELLDESSGAMRQEFLRSDPLDHHLAFLAFAPVLAARLRDLGFT